MDLKAFTGSKAGTLVRISGTDPRTGREFEHKAFVPAPLPDATPPLNAVTWGFVTRASLALGRLDQAGRQLPNPMLLRRPAIRREAVSTSALEGTHAAFEDVLEADIEEDSAPGPEVREVLNYVWVAELALDQIKERPVTTGMLSELQDLLVRGTPGESSDSGKVRNLQVVVGTPGGRVEDARYVPPPPGDQLVAGLRHWEEWIEENRTFEPVIAVALTHYQFEALHPFNDGNGRLGRLVVVLQLVRRDVLHDGLLTISPWLEQRRTEYQDHLLRVSQTGDFEPWIQFFAEGLRERADAATSQIERLLSFQETTRELVRAFPLRGVAAQIADDLIGRPVVTVASAARKHGVTFQAANTAIARLVRAGLLREVTGERYRRVFASDEVLRLVQT